MTQLILFLVLGAVFAVLLYFFARRSGTRPEGGAEALVSARQALNSLQGNLLPAELVHRVFAREDLDFVTSIGSSAIRKAFVRERKHVALRWVGQVRKHVLSLKQFHSGRSRFYAQLDLRTEIELAARFASLLFICRLLEAVFYVRGPFAAPRIVRTAIGAAGTICVASERSLAFLSTASSPDLAGGGSTGRSA
ncbi:MAG TPA: hypothetical protein VJQ82_12715 [Terriglobales bacterium]|nr:hypothetical protein [Terriglobales bacterium]